MATAEDYASWIVNNQDKKGTPEFDTVAQAYRQAKSGMPQKADISAAPQEQSTSLFKRISPTKREYTGESIDKTASEIFKTKQDEEVGAPGISAGVDPRSVAYPMLEMGAMGVGGAFGGLPGAALGYAGAKGLQRDISEYTGESPRESLPASLVTAAKDIGTGALYDIAPKALAKALGSTLSFGAKFLPKKEAQTLESLAAEKAQAWDKVNKATSEYQGTPFQNKANEIATKEFNYDPDTHPALNNVVNRINNISGTSPTSIREFRTIRDLLQDVEKGNVVTKNGEIIPAGKDEQALATALKKNLDSFIANQGDEGAIAWKDARDVSSKIYKSKETQQIIADAEKSTAPTSKEIRNKFDDLRNSNLINSYTPEQREVINQIANGTATQKTLETIGRMAPKSVSWKSILTLMGLGGGAVAAKLPGAATGAAILVPAFGAGLASRAASSALAKSQVRTLDELIRGGGLAPKVDLSFLAPAGTAGFIFGNKPTPQQLASALSNNDQNADTDRQRKLAYQLSLMQNQE